MSRVVAMTAGAASGSSPSDADLWRDLAEAGYIPFGVPPDGKVTLMNYHHAPGDSAAWAPSR